jgi:hypothetical protein
MDVKSAFLNGVIQEEVYVSQPPGFKNPIYPDSVQAFKGFIRAMQAPRAWFARFKTFLLEHEYVIGSVLRSSFLLIMALTFYLFRFTWMISSLVALLTLLCPNFWK